MEWYESAESGALSRAASHPQLEGCRSEGEVLPNAAFEVAEVRGRHGAAGKKGERRWVGGTLGCVQHPDAPGCRLGGLGRLQHLVELPGRDPPVVGVDRLAEGRDKLVDPLAAQRADLQHGGIAEELE